MHFTTSRNQKLESFTTNEIRTIFKIVTQNTSTIGTFAYHALFKLRFHAVLTEFVLSYSGHRLKIWDMNLSDQGTFFLGNSPPFTPEI